MPRELLLVLTGGSAHYCLLCTSVGIPHASSLDTLSSLSVNIEVLWRPTSKAIVAYTMM